MHVCIRIYEGIFLMEDQVEIFSPQYFLLVFCSQFEKTLAKKPMLWLISC